MNDIYKPNELSELLNYSKCLGFVYKTQKSHIQNGLIKNNIF